MVTSPDAHPVAATPAEAASGPSAPVAEIDPAQTSIDQFHVELDVFQGPFDLLLQLITRKRLDITQVSMAEVTDEFISHMRAFPDLSRTTEFLVVAATLLSMKAAHLLPRPAGDDDEDAEELEARDLLFARLLQYRAFKMASAAVAERLDATAGSYARDVPLEPHFAALLPELVWQLTGEQLAQLAADALSQRPPEVQVTHLHDPTVPVGEQAAVLVARLQSAGSATFRELVADAPTTAVTVSRFLALLELFRRRMVDFGQDEALGELRVDWTGEPEGDVDLSGFEPEWEGEPDND